MVFVFVCHMNEISYPFTVFAIWQYNKVQDENRILFAVGK
jgi:hypothetical protein